MKKDFNIKDFVNGYVKNTNQSDRESYIRTKLKTLDYLDYSEKVLVAENIIGTTSYAIVSSEKDKQLKRTNKIKFNSPMRYVLFVMTVVNKYTNIEVDSSNAMPDFDLLNKNGLIEIIFDAIGEREITELKTIIDMVLQDFRENECNINSLITNQVESLFNAIENFIPMIDKIIDKLKTIDEKEIDNISNKIEKIFKFLK